MIDSKIHCIMLCKNEGDVIGHCLESTSSFADSIYVYDGLSEDNTWDVVNSLAKTNRRIVPWKQDGKAFSEGLRAEVFSEFRHRSVSGDWWMQVNADEFYPDCPRKFFSRVPASNSFVWGTMAEYVLTEKEIETVDFSQPFENQIENFRHYYVQWSEPRAFRYRNRLKWRFDAAWPVNAGVVARERLLYKHYPIRSVSQARKRVQTRMENRDLGFEGWEPNIEQWRSEIKDSEEFIFDDGVTPIFWDEASLPRHLETPIRRVCKYLLHGIGILP